MKANRNKSCFERFIREERAAAPIVEYSIVLPICLFILGLLFASGFYLNQKAVLDSAVNRGVVLAQKIYCDNNADRLMNMGIDGNNYQVGVTIDSNALKDPKNLKSEPYRYLKFGSRYDDIYSVIEKKITNSVNTSQLINADIRLSDLSINMPKKFKGFMIYKMTVTVTQDFYNPFVPVLVRESTDSLFSMKSSATAAVMSTTEYVRNVDMLNDVMGRFTGSTCDGWVSKMLGRLNTFMSKTGVG